MATKKSTAKQPDGQLSLLTDHAGSGLEEVTSKDLVLSRLAILQKLSPALDEDKPGYIPGAKQGQILDTANERIYDAVRFVLIQYKKQWLEWAPRNTGAGLIAVYDSEECCEGLALNDRKVPTRENGNYIMETANFLGLNITDPDEQVVSFISMASTQHKNARKWLTMAMGERIEDAHGNKVTPPSWARVYELTTRQESNSEGSWHGWKIDRAETIIDWAKDQDIELGAFATGIENLRAPIAGAAAKQIEQSDSEVM